MRIIRGHDYYDSALAFGQDDETVFVRERNRFLSTRTAPFSIDGWNLSFEDAKQQIIRLQYSNHQFMANGKSFALWPIAVIFCGKLYCGMRLDEELLGGSTFFWDLPAFQAWLDGMKLQVRPNMWRSRRRAPYGKNEKPIDIAKFFATSDATREQTEWLVINKIVVAIYHGTMSGHQWDINSDRLKDVQFYKRVDAYTAFQEIAMWVGGVLPSSGNAMAEVSDMVRIEKHGFDRVTSFRNMKRD